MKLSILDQSPIAKGKTAKEALEASLQLAKTADELGYYRYWIAEHHDLPGLASSSPEIMMSYIASQTSTIRIGSGALLLPNYKPFKVAENFHLLSTLFPGRIDLGIGRAPGASAEASIALAGNYLQAVKEWPQSIDTLLAFLNDHHPEDHLFRKVKASPIPPIKPEVWMLGTSHKSASVAAEKGLHYCFGQFMSEANGKEAIDLFKEKRKSEQQNMMLTVSVICAETDEKAEEIATSVLLWHLQSDDGEKQEVPSVEEAIKHPYFIAKQEKVAKMKERMIIGNPEKVKRDLLSLTDQYGIDEVMIVTITHDYDDRLKSYKLLADMFNKPVF